MFHSRRRKIINEAEHLETEYASFVSSNRLLTSKAGQEYTSSGRSVIYVQIRNRCFNPSVVVHCT
jgi:hypothetical protein